MKQKTQKKAAAKKKKAPKTEEFTNRLPVYDMKGKSVDTIQLDEKLFNGEVNKALLYQAERMYEANLRRGTASTKTRAEVSGGGIKPWRQKGTGRARVGSTRNPVWRHGGIAFGPKVRDYSYSIPKKAVKGALLSGINARLKEGMIKAVEKIELNEPKTKIFKAILDNLKIKGNVLVVVDAASGELKRSARNIKEVSLRESANINARDVLLNENVLIEKKALESLTKRLG